MKRFFLNAILLLLSAAVLAQDQTRPIKVPLIPNRGLGTPYTDRPPDITLVPHGPDARQGQIWVHNVGDGLLIVGQVDGDPPDFPRNKNSPGRSKVKPCLLTRMSPPVDPGHR